MRGFGDVVLVEAAPALAAHEPAFVRAFGALGTPTCTTACSGGTMGGDAGQFHNPYGVAVSGSGDVYVADAANERVDEFSQAGVFVRAFGKDVGGSGVECARARAWRAAKVPARASSTPR